MKQAVLTGLGFAVMGTALLGYSWTVKQQILVLDNRITELEESKSQIERAVPQRTVQPKPFIPRKTRLDVRQTDESGTEKPEQALDTSNSNAAPKMERARIREERLESLVTILAEELDWTEAEENDVVDALSVVTGQRTELRRMARDGELERAEVRDRMLDVRDKFREDIVSIVGQEDAETVFQRLSGARQR